MTGKSKSELMADKGFRDGDEAMAYWKQCFKEYMAELNKSFSKASK